MSRTELSFDGFGINGPDEHRSRLVTFANNVNEADRKKYGKLFEASPVMFVALEKLEAILNAMPDAGSSPTNVAFDKWRLYTDALNIIRDAKASAKPE
jgi:hypothetical protein